MAAISDDPIREWILSKGKATNITRISPIGGGCINLANRYDTDAGSFFVKTNRCSCDFQIIKLDLMSLKQIQTLDYYEVVESYI